MAERSLQELLITNFDLSPSGYTGSRGGNGVNGYAGSAGPAGAGFAGPRITSIGYPDDDTAANTAGGDTITLTGANFAAGAQVVINGNAASVVSVVNSTTITFTAPPNPTGSYILYVLNTDGATTLAVPGLQYSGTPAWTTAAGTLGSPNKQSSFTVNLTATGDAPVTYSLYSGSLPAGLTLTANTGVISGTTPNLSVETTYNFTIRATDAQRQDTNRAFSITITQAPPITDISSITATSATAFSYVAIPGSPRSLLNYITSFGVSGGSSNDGGSTWNNAYATLSYTASPITSVNYFTSHNRVRVIDGDGSADGPDWTVFNFGVSNGGGDYDGNADTNAYFGGENTSSGGRGSSSSTVGRIWGFSAVVGWVLLYQLPLGSGSGSSYNHTNGNWFNSGSSVGSGNGKRSDYDTASITHIGFSVT
jgi:hypothetical protein